MKEINIQRLVRENVLKLKPYASARDDFQGSASVFLDANENPFPSDYNRYPDPHQHALRSAIAKMKDLNENQVFPGNGSDEVIDLLLRAFCEPGKDEVIIPVPTYGMYAVSAGVNDVRILSPQLTNEFDIDTQGILSAVTPNTKIIFLCSPNNPSGNLLSADRIKEVLDGFDGLVVIDEAYIDFTDSISWTEKLSIFKNLVVMQTFSKAWGLAGLRLGVCFADAEILRVLEKIKPPYNIGTFTQATALKAIQSMQNQKEDWVNQIKIERKRLKSELVKLASVKSVYHSDANFLLVQMTGASKVYRSLVSKGIIVRDRSNIILCDDCLRITIGTRDENHQLLNALQNL